MKTKSCAAICCLIYLLASHAHALVINVGVGQPKNSGDANILNWLNSSITIYNESNNSDLPIASAALVNFKNNQGDNNGTSGYPTFGEDITSITIPIGGYNYVALHWGGSNKKSNKASNQTPSYQAFYIGNLGSGTSTFDFSNKDKHGLSWYAMFNPTTPISRKVPDGGTTFISLGGALLGLASIRRLFARKA